VRELHIFAGGPTTAPTVSTGALRSVPLRRPLLDLRVSVTGGVHFDLVKRVLRDIKRSGQGPDEIIQQACHFWTFRHVHLDSVLLAKGLGSWGKIY
jgi:hypothetical protein